MFFPVCVVASSPLLKGQVPVHVSVGLSPLAHLLALCGLHGDEELAKEEERERREREARERKTEAVVVSG